MMDENAGPVLGALDKNIQHYIGTRRTQIDVFINKHFSVKETVEIQKKTFPVDLIYIPLNTLWSVPYLSIKKVNEILEKLGWTKFSTGIERLPSGIKTGYQKEIEKYTSSQAMILDLSSSLVTLCLGGILFGDKTLNVLGLGNKIAHKMAVNEAASDFFLGKSLGKSFYSAFPPEPSRMQILIATLGVGLFLTMVSLVTSVMSDPLRKSLGLHKRKLNCLINDLEETLFLHFRKEVKKNQKDLVLHSKAS